MDMILCSDCQKNETALNCGMCACAVCKSCAQFLEPESFEFAPSVTPEIKHGVFCQTCYGDKVAQPLAEYFDVLETAKNIDVYFKDQSKETRLVRRKEKPVSVAPCDDRDDVVMKLAYFAALGGFDSVVDIDLKSEKVFIGTYSKLVWKGSGVPAQAKGKVINTDKSIWHNPN